MIDIHQQNDLLSCFVFLLLLYCLDTRALFTDELLQLNGYNINKNM